MRLFVLLVLTCFGSLNTIRCQTFQTETNKAIDSVFQSLSLDQKIGQLIMTSGYSSSERYNLGELEYLVRNYQIGGIIFLKGSPHKQALMTNQLQQQSKIPLMIGMDAEWGLHMRLDSVINFPRQMALAATDSDSLIYEFAQSVAFQCKRLGVHINFAPVVDINNNPLNPVINDRAWGDSKKQVIRFSEIYMNGLQQNGILACIKHFPGHGDTETDSHFDLPVIPFSQKRLDTLELAPFQYLIDKGAKSLMTAHLYVPALEPMKNLPSSLSQRIIRYKLRDSMGFNGLIFTDALNMKGVTKFYKRGQLEVMALMAGNDILLFPEDVPMAVAAIKTALDSCLIPMEQFEQSVKRMLEAKYQLGILHQTKLIDTANLIADLNNARDTKLQAVLAEHIITGIRWDKKEKSKAKQKCALIALGDKSHNSFQQMMLRYGNYDCFGISPNTKPIFYANLIAYLKQEDYDKIIFSVHNTNRYAKRNYGLNSQDLELMRLVSEYTATDVVSFGIPYNLSFFDNAKNLLVAYQDLPFMQEKAAMALSGVMPISGKLPVSFGGHESLEVFTFDSTLLHFDKPERFGYLETDFSNIDSIIQYAIQEKAMPGCQVFVSKGNQVLLNKSYGYHDYDKTTEVSENDLYDIASITKIASTTLIIMDLYERKKIELDDNISKYIKELKKTDKARITIKELLTHTSGLKAWIPFYESTTNKEDLYFCHEPNSFFCEPVARGYFTNPNMRDSVLKWIAESKLNKSGQYLYSDLGFYLLQMAIEKITKTTLDKYFEKHFAEPMQLSHITFKPKEKKTYLCTVPTEYDYIFRQQQINGTVHDPGAAMLGGVAGNAGLFSNAVSLATLFQPFFYQGYYRNQKYFKPSTIELFCKAQNKNNRRGLGFDKPELNLEKSTPCSKYASPASFGHSGFTGTFIWIDPTYDLVYVFLSNRVNPDASNNKLVKWNVRTAIQDEIYKILLEK